MASKRKPKLDNMIIRMSDGTPISSKGIPKSKEWGHTAMHFEHDIPPTDGSFYPRSYQRRARTFEPPMYVETVHPPKEVKKFLAYQRRARTFDGPMYYEHELTPFDVDFNRPRGAYTRRPRPPAPLGWGSVVGAVPTPVPGARPVSKAAGRAAQSIGGESLATNRNVKVLTVAEEAAMQGSKAGRFAKLLGRGLGVLGILGVAHSVLSDVQKERMARFMAEMETRKRLDFGNTLRQEEWLAKFLDSEDRLDAAVGRFQRREELDRINRDAVITAKSARLRNSSVQQPPGALELELMLSQLREEGNDVNG